MPIDTLQLSKDLQKDFTAAQAETLARVLHQRITEDLATKQDLKNLELCLRADIQALELSLRGEIKDLKAETIKWIVGALVVNFFGVAGLMITLIKAVPH